LPSNAGAHLSLGANGLCRVLLCVCAGAQVSDLCAGVFVLAPERWQRASAAAS